MILMLWMCMQVPQTYGWELLSSLDIRVRYDDFMGMEVQEPVFSEKLRRHEGLPLTLDGFVIPLETSLEDQNYFILSRFPYQSCFFCGGAGPETVVEVYSQEEFRFSDDLIRVRGTLTLIEDNPFHLFFVLKDAEIIERE